MGVKLNSLKTNKQIMKKFFTTLKSIANVVVVALVAMSVSLSVSCSEDCTFEPYDDTEIWNAIEDIYERIEALETQLQNEVKTLKGMIEGQITIKSVDTDSNGVRTVNLSDGSTLKIYPEYDAQGLVTIMTVEGTQVWAVINADGEAEAVKDADGNMIPVSGGGSTVAPEVRLNEETNTYEISFDGGNTWATTGAADGCSCPVIFTGVEVVDDGDEYYPQPLYVRLYLADGNTITVTIEGVDTLVWGGHMGMIESMYIPAGTTDDQNIGVSALAGGLEGLIIQKPEGWKVAYKTDTYMTQVIVTAPSAEAIAAGAPAEGELIAMGQFVGGKTATATMKVTTIPVTIAAANGSATFTPAGGVQEFAYGILPAAEYDEATAISTILDVYNNWMFPESPYGSNYYECTVDLVELYGQELVAGAEYVVFAGPIGMDYSTYSYTLAELVAVPYVHKSVKVEATSVSFNDIQVSIEMAGVTTYYASVTEAAYFNVDYLVEELNSPYVAWSYDALTYAEPYAGSLAGVPNSNPYSSLSMMPSQNYIMWIAIIEDGKTFTASDILVFDFSTSGLEAGGTLAVAVEAEQDYKMVNFNISAENAAYIYYAGFITEDDTPNRYNQFSEDPIPATDEEKIAYLLGNNGYVAEGGFARASTSNYLTSGDKLTVIALAVDAEGKYGPLFCEEYTPKQVEYSNLVVSIDEKNTSIGETLATVQWTVAGGQPAKYCYYFVDPNSDAYKYWYNRSNYCNGTAEGFENYVMTNPSGYSTYVGNGYIKETSEAVASGLEMVAGTEYAIVIMAQDENGLWSHVVEYKFKPAIPEVVLNYVDSTQEAWTNTKPTNVKYSVEKPMGDFYPTNAWITPAAVGGVEYYAYSSTDDVWSYENIDTTNKEAVAKFIIENGELFNAENTVVFPHNGVGREGLGGRYPDWHVFIAWKDATNIYQAVKFTTSQTDGAVVETEVATF